MAKRNETYIGISHEIIIEVISIKGKEVFKKEMSYGEALKLKKKNGWNYIFYQLGASQFKEAKTLLK